VADLSSGTDDAYGSDYGQGYHYAGCGYGLYGVGYADGDGYSGGCGHIGGAYDHRAAVAGDGRGNAYGHLSSDGGPEYGIGYADGAGLGGGYGRGMYGGVFGGSGGGYGRGMYGGVFGSGGMGYDGTSDYWIAAIDIFAGRWPQLWRERLASARARGAVIAYWRSDANGRPCNGGYGRPVYAGMIEHTGGPLQLCSRGTLHATVLPPAYHGERCWIVALDKPITRENEKIGALRREIIGEVI
jgi:hypothetical protein